MSERYLSFRKKRKSHAFTIGQKYTYLNMPANVCESWLMSVNSLACTSTTSKIHSVYLKVYLKFSDYFKYYF